MNAAPTKRIDFAATGKRMLAGVTVAAQRPHKRMKTVGRRAVQLVRTSGPSQAGDKPQRYSPSPHPPGFRPRIGVRDRL